MGLHSSGSTSVPTFEQIIQSSVTALSAASDLAGIIGDFTGLTPRELVLLRSSERNDPTTVLQRLLKAMDDSKPYCTAAFKTQFNNAPTGTDSGLILNYSQTGNLDGVVKQIETNFNNWGISLSADQIMDMANTIATEVDAKLGQVGSSFGSFSIDANDTLNWTVAYGTFAQTDAGVLALIYAFSAQEVGGFGRKLHSRSQ